MSKRLRAEIEELKRKMEPSAAREIAIRFPDEDRDFLTTGSTITVLKRFSGFKERDRYLAVAVKIIDENGRKFCEAHLEEIDE